MPASANIHIHVWSEHFLGTQEKGGEFLDLIETMDCGMWMPQHWGHFEPINRNYSPAARDAILSALTESRGGRTANHIYLCRKAPSASISLMVWRSRVPDLNHVWLVLEASAYEDESGPGRLEKMVLDLVAWSRGVLATARHSEQALYRVVQMTPLQRLRQLDWLSFFGEPYIEMFGKDRALSAPSHRTREMLGGVLLLAAPRPNSPDITTSPDRLLALEAHLGADAFAGNGYPSIPCRVPRFNLSETIV
jgi:hypothetical protein